MVVDSAAEPEVTPRTALVARMLVLSGAVLAELTVAVAVSVDVVPASLALAVVVATPEICSGMPEVSGPIPLVVAETAPDRAIRVRKTAVRLVIAAAPLSKSGMPVLRLAARLVVAKVLAATWMAVNRSALALVVAFAAVAGWIAAVSAAEADDDPAVPAAMAAASNGM